MIFVVGRYPAECYPTIQQYEQSALLFHNRRHLSRPSSTSTTSTTNTKSSSCTGKAWSYMLTRKLIEWHLPWTLWLHEHAQLGSKRSVWQRVSKLENGDLEEVVTNFQEIKALSTCKSLNLKGLSIYKFSMWIVLNEPRAKIWQLSSCIRSDWEPFPANL